MDNKRPGVFPTQEQMNSAKIENDRISAYEREKLELTNEIYVNSSRQKDISGGQIGAVEAMRLRTEEQLRAREVKGVVKEESLADKTNSRLTTDEIMQQRNQEQMRIRDEQLKKNQEQITNYQISANKATARNNTNENTELYPQNNKNQINNQMPENNQSTYVPPMPPSQPPVNNGYGDNYGVNPSNINPYILELSQPNYNAPFDVIPLPSEGKLYKNKKANIRIGFMTTADENILTSPNLLQSGEFLEILINRKILEPELRYKDLHIGDRNAIMIWLRATGYGEMYPVTLLDEKNIPFDTEINLHSLKMKKLGAEPDADGLFDFKFPLSKSMVKFKLLTCGDVDKIEKMLEHDKANNIPVNNSNTYTMECMIVEVDGSRDRNVIRDFVSSIRIKDAKDLNSYVDKIESGIDLDIEVGTPGGSSISTFLPLNINFFWPNIGV